MVVNVSTDVLTLQAEAAEAVGGGTRPGLPFGPLRLLREVHLGLHVFGREPVHELHGLGGTLGILLGRRGLADVNL